MPSINKTVLITGASSGIGLETALYFFEQGWQVVATMRHPDQRKTKLHERGLPDLLHLDVGEPASIQAAIQTTLAKYRQIDVLVNNAGYALQGPFEAAAADQVRRQFETNVFGLMEVTRAMLPVFRRQQHGCLINVASMGGRVGFPLYSVYNSTKWAVDGFSEALQYELKPLNIRVRIVEPGIIKTDFYGRSMDFGQPGAMAEAYQSTIKRSQRLLGENATRAGVAARVVAQTIFRAATDNSGRLRYVVGPDAQALILMRWLLPEWLFYKLVERATLG